MGYIRNLLLLLSININFIIAQSNYNFFCEKISDYDTNSLVLNVNNINFLKNNEYFSNFVDGYTLFGNIVQPTLNYSPTPKILIIAGIHTLYYFGTNNFTQIRPIFSLRYRPIEQFTIVFGQLNSTINHQMPPTIYNEEYLLTKNIENGLQFIFQNRRFNSDLWIDWREFIFPNSPYPEMFVVGNTSKINFLYTKSIGLSLSSFTTISHIGGQIDTSGVPVQSLLNNAMGLEINFKTSGNAFLKVFSLAHNFADISPEKKLPFVGGYAWLNGVAYENRYFQINLQHWYANNYYSLVANSLFLSIGTKNQSVYRYRNVFINQFFVTFVNSKLIKIGLAGDLYYDLLNRTLDYSYGFYIKSNLSFRLM